MKSGYLCLLALPACLLALTAQAQTPAPGADISDYHLEGRPANADNGGTSLSITYDDGTHFIEALPKKSSIDGDIPAVFSDVRLADDKQTLGWKISDDGCCQSYPVPVTLVLYRAGKIVHRITQGQMLWDWEFADGGTRVATVWGPTHGTANGDYRLYNVAEDKMTEEVYGENGTLGPDAPAWARHLENKSRKPAR